MARIQTALSTFVVDPATLTAHSHRPIAALRVRHAAAELPADTDQTANNQPEILDRLATASKALGLPELLSGLKFRLTNCGDLRIEGQIESFYLKQTVQELALRDAAVRNVDNRLQVTPNRRFRVVSPR